MQEIAEALETDIVASTYKAMFEQNVPRNRIADGIDLQVYRRCGWVPPKSGASDRDELNERREDVALESSVEAMKLLDKLCLAYEEEHWNPGKIV